MLARARSGQSAGIGGIHRRATRDHCLQDPAPVRAPPQAGPAQRRGGAAARRPPRPAGGVPQARVGLARVAVPPGGGSRRTHVSDGVSPACAANGSCSEQQESRVTCPYAT
jgi:hypothetical protein